MTERPPGEAGRPSAVQPQVKLERRVSPFFATIFYGFFGAAAWIWLSAGLKVDPATLWIPAHPVRDVAVGLAVAALFLGATPLLLRRSAAVRDLEKEFGWILGEQRPGEIVYLALLSGAAEEFLFRGALSHAAGPIFATALFAAVHWPVNWSFRLWPILALVAGTAMTLETLWTGSLVAAAVTHAAINGVNLFRITGKYRVWKE
jgi:membrane protease YdiL (CAAX protease family)